MSENPYAAYPSQHNHYDDGGGVATRVSALAVLSLICAIACCIPGLGVVAALLGIGAMIGISTSMGRVTGQGMAMTGVILGLVCTVLWGAVFVGAAGIYKVYDQRMVGATNDFLREVLAGDVNAARGLLGPSAAQNTTDEDIAAFARAMADLYGARVGPPSDFFDLLTAFGEAMQGRAKLSAPDSSVPFVPMPIRFDGGTALVVACFDQGAFGNNQTFILLDVLVLMQDGRGLTLRENGPATTLAQDMGVTPVSAMQWVAEKAAAP